MDGRILSARMPDVSPAFMRLGKELSSGIRDVSQSNLARLSVQ